MGACGSLRNIAREPDTSREFECAYTPTGETLGFGSFGHVSSMVSSQSGRRRAVKIICFEDSSGKVDAKRRWYALREEKLLRCVRGHRCVVKLLKSYIDEEKCNVMIVMEQCAAPLLNCVAYLLEAAQECEISELLRDMLLGLQYVHGKRIVHRDVKLDNFLFTSLSDGTLKLSDFGLADILPRGCITLNGCYGTAPYMSPEMAGRAGHNLSTDIWSLGVIAYVLIFGNFPYGPGSKDRLNMKLAIVTGLPKPMYLPVSCSFRARSSLAKEFTEVLLCRSLAARPTARQMLSHPLVITQPDSFQALVKKTPRGHTFDLVKRSKEYAKFRAAEISEQDSPLSSTRV